MGLNFVLMITLWIPITLAIADSNPEPTMATLKPAVTASGKVSGRGSGYGGHGGGSYGHGGGGGYGHGAVTMDPVSILGLLSLGAFLIRSILSLISSSARSIDPVDLDVPLQLSDIADIADIADRIQSWEPTHVVRERSASSEVTTLLQTAFHVFQKGPACSRKILCERWKSRGFVENRLEDLFLISLAGWVGDDSGAALYDAVSQLHEGDHPILCQADDNEATRFLDC